MPFAHILIHKNSTVSVEGVDTVDLVGKGEWSVEGDQKLENVLRLALETGLEERMQTEDLNVGFDETKKTWELIVKYHGNLDGLRQAGIAVEELIAGYAILTVPEELVERITELSEIEYVEKPKRYYYGMDKNREDGRNTEEKEQPERDLDYCAAESSFVSSTAVSMEEVKREACISQVTDREPFLTGQGVLMAVLDSGIDISLPAFRNADGTTRILSLWDQAEGKEYDSRQINDALRRQGGDIADYGMENGSAVYFNDPSFTERYAVNHGTESVGNVYFNSGALPGRDVTGHGTAVTAIAAGSTVGPNRNDGLSYTPNPGYEGIAPQASILFVKLGIPDQDSFPRTTEIMRGVTYAIRKALTLSMPLVINLSFGNCYGAHDGASLLERFLDNAAEIGRTVICVGNGNEGNSAGHTAGNVRERRVIELAVSAYERSLSIQLWKQYSDQYRIYLIAPDGSYQELPGQSGKSVFSLGQTKILAYSGAPTPYSVNQEIYLELIPDLTENEGENQDSNSIRKARRYIDSGIWQIFIEPVKVVTGQYYLYLPGRDGRNEGTGFLSPTPQVTVTIPATSSKILSVGAYDSKMQSYADFSGRGYTDSKRTIGVVTAGLVKPDIAAPGVDIIAPQATGTGTGYAAFSGTSFATPIVSGSAALVMEWGIVRRNDPFLYGEKLKAYLRAGARALRGEQEYPNDRVGYGALCVAQSLPKI